MLSDQEKDRKKSGKRGNTEHFRTWHGIKTVVNSVPYKQSDFGHVSKLVTLGMLINLSSVEWESSNYLHGLSLGAQGKDLVQMLVTRGLQCGAFITAKSQSISLRAQLWVFFVDLRSGPIRRL